MYEHCIREKQIFQIVVLIVQERSTYYDFLYRNTDGLAYYRKMLNKGRGAENIRLKKGARASL